MAPDMGQVRLTAPFQVRFVQVYGHQIRSVRVTLTRHDGSRIEKRRLRSSVSGRKLTFDTFRLPAGNYIPTVSVFMDEDETMACGEVTGSTFTVSADALTVLTLPVLNLGPTPLGEWTVSTTVPAELDQHSVSYTYTLILNDGSTLATTSTRPFVTWGNVPVWPDGTCKTQVFATVRSTGDVHVSMGEVTARLTVNSMATSSVALWTEGLPW